MPEKVRKNKILILGSGVYARPFYKHGDCLLASDIADVSEFDWNSIKLVVFTGGSDVDPTMYNEKKHKRTHSNLYRDKRERVFFNLCKVRKIPMVGICRGSQFLTVMNGGRLMQDVNNHTIAGTHSIITDKGKSIDVTSTHHQMMFPKGNFELLAWAKGLSDKYETGEGVIRSKGKEFFREPEVVYYPSTKCLAVQFHPEYMNDDTSGYIYFQDLIKEYVL